MIIVACVFLLAVFLWATRDSWRLHIGDYLVVRDTLQHADVIHVIAGDDHRTEYAIQLYKDGYADTLFYTGDWCITHPAPTIPRQIWRRQWQLTWAALRGCRRRPGGCV